MGFNALFTVIQRLSRQRSLGLEERGIVFDATQETPHSLRLVGILQGQLAKMTIKRGLFTVGIYIYIYTGTPI